MYHGSTLEKKSVKNYSLQPPNFMDNFGFEHFCGISSSSILSLDVSQVQIFLRVCDW